MIMKHKLLVKNYILVVTDLYCQLQSSIKLIERLCLLHMKIKHNLSLLGVYNHKIYDNPYVVQIFHSVHFFHSNGN